MWSLANWWINGWIETIRVVRSATETHIGPMQNQRCQRLAQKLSWRDWTTHPSSFPSLIIDRGLHRNDCSFITAVLSFPSTSLFHKGSQLAQWNILSSIESLPRGTRPYGALVWDWNLTPIVASSKGCLKKCVCAVDFPLSLSFSISLSLLSPLLFDPI